MIDERIEELLDLLDLNEEEEEELVNYFNEADDFVDLNNAAITLIEELDPDYDSDLFSLLTSFLWGSKEMIQDFLCLFMEDVSLDQAIQILTNISLALHVLPDGRIDDTELDAISSQLEQYMSGLN